jgi:hypothetical protein
MKGTQCLIACSVAAVEAPGTVLLVWQECCRFVRRQTVISIFDGEGSRFIQHKPITPHSVHVNGYWVMIFYLYRLSCFYFSKNEFIYFENLEISFLIFMKV